MSRRANVGHRFAIVLDNKVISAPVIREADHRRPRPDQRAASTPSSATDLALLLRAGALPAPLTVVEERSVGPELGADAIRAGAIALAVGFVLVIVFMAAVLRPVRLVREHRPGRQPDPADGRARRCSQATLTLPGMAGILLTLGMAVDANILINERIREEVRNGRTPLNAMETGFRARLRHHHRQQRDRLPGARHAVHLRRRAGARLRRDHHASASSPRCSPRPCWRGC